MNKHTQRLAIAEFCKWTDIRPVLDDDPETFGIDLVGKRNGGRDYVPLPDYLNEVSARRDAWQSLSRLNKLTFAVYARQAAMRHGVCVFEAALDHWPEILLRTIGKWEDEE